MRVRHVDNVLISACYRNMYGQFISYEKRKGGSVMALILGVIPHVLYWSYKHDIMSHVCM